MFLNFKLIYLFIVKVYNNYFYYYKLIDEIIILDYSRILSTLFKNQNIVSLNPSNNSVNS
jgi:hypothetical protein